MKSTTYIVEKLPKRIRGICLKGEIHLLAFLLPARLLVSCQLGNFPRKFIEKYFAVFDQQNCVIYLTWYRSLLFFREFFSIIIFMV